MRFLSSSLRIGLALASGAPILCAAARPLRPVGVKAAASVLSCQALSPVDVYAERPEISTSGLRRARRESAETARPAGPLAVFSSQAARDRLQWLLEKLERERDRNLSEFETLGAIAKFLGPKIAEIEDAHPFMTVVMEGIEDALINLGDPLKLLDGQIFDERLRGYLRAAVRGEGGLSYSYWEESERLFLEAHADVLSGTALQAFLMGRSGKRLKDLHLWRRRSSNSDIDGVLRLAHAAIVTGAIRGVAEKITEAGVRKNWRRQKPGIVAAGRRGARAAHVRWNLEQALPTGGWLAVMSGMRRIFSLPPPSPAVLRPAGFLRSA